MLNAPMPGRVGPDAPRPYQDGDPSSFDFVIAGGGTAGLALARRLAVYWTVAVIEAGEYHPHEPLINTPGMFGRALGNPSFDYSYQTVPQVDITGSSTGTNAVLYSQGKMLGGSSGLNIMCWGIGSEQEYDAWEELGNPGWNWPSFQRYFARTATTTAPVEADVLAGTTLKAMQPLATDDGPVQVKYPAWKSTIIDPVVRALNTLGVKTNPAPRTGNNLGLTNQMQTVDSRGARSYAANSYWRQDEASSNLKIFTNTTVLKVAISKSSGLRAHGLEIMTDAGNWTLHAAKEVIVSSGAFGSPRMLELSGIGNRDILTQAGIPILYALPGVGENLQEHAASAVEWTLKAGELTQDSLRNDESFAAEQTAEYETHHTGALAYATGVVAFVAPDILVQSTGLHHTLKDARQRAHDLSRQENLSPLRQKQYEIQSRWLRQDDVACIEGIILATGGLSAIPPSPNDNYLNIVPAVMHPFARGTAHINASDPHGAPVIDPRLMSERVDQDVLTLGVAFAGQLGRTAPFNGHVESAHSPPAEVYETGQWHQHALSFVNILWHAIGTCAMAPEDWGGVVGPDFKVHGVHGLRVVDASIMPLHISAHTVATVYALAERAADAITSEHLAAGL